MRRIAEIRRSRIWTVSAKVAGEPPGRWVFENKEAAQWFRDVVNEWFWARCPKCEAKDSINLDLEGVDPSDLFKGLAATVACAWSEECGFTGKVPRGQLQTEEGLQPPR